MRAEQQRAVVCAWIAARESGESQVSFCARQKPRISTRTLRAWMRQHALGKAAVPELRRVVIGALQQLQQILNVLDEDMHPARPTMSVGCQHVNDDDPPTASAPPNGSPSARPNLLRVRGDTVADPRRGLFDLVEEDDS